MKVDVGVAASKNQAQKWWSALLTEALRLERQGRIRLGEAWVVGSALTDFNRNEVVSLFLQRDADALWFIDDDTIPPRRAVEWLADLRRDIAAGVYYMRSGVHNPLVYKRQANRLYTALARFEPGEIVRGDSVGMGCTLIQRRVFEGIMAAYVVFRRVMTGTVTAVHLDDVVGYTGGRAEVELVHEMAGKMLRGPGRRGYWIEPMVEIGPEELREAGLTWPFYVQEHGRTEDHSFTEKARRCGFEVWADTMVECDHVGDRPVNREDFQKVMDAVGSYIALKGELGE